MQTYPICLVWLDRRRSVVIGGGAVAARKTAALLAAGAAVTAISPQFSPEFMQLAHPAALQLIQRPYQEGDLEGAFLVISATDVPEVNQAVYAEGLRRGCLINVVDDPQHSNFIVPAVVRRGEVQVAVTTGGSSPALARRLREHLERWLRPAYGDLAALLAELRPELLRRFAPGQARLQAALSLVDADLLDVIEHDGMEAARQRAAALLDTFSEGSQPDPTR
jgi:precorrin-2 dehydrogenase / sirohydrochlorin ferrochelatase